jgi:hypothetical protein
MNVEDFCAEAGRENAVRRSAKNMETRMRRERFATAGIVRGIAACSCDAELAQRNQALNIHWGAARGTSRRHALSGEEWQAITRVELFGGGCVVVDKRLSGRRTAHVLRSMWDTV